MIAKEYLSQAFRLDNRINSKIDQIASLNDLATKCGSSITGMPRNPSPATSLMADAVTKRTGPDPRLPTFPMRVFLSNETDPECTFVEIQALDRIGLLFDVFRTVARHGLEVHHARINTTKGAAIDSFYLTTRDGHQMTDPQALRDFHRAMEEAIGVTPAGEESEA